MWAKQKLHLPRTVARALPGYRRQVVFTEHHESHAASAFFPSPFAEAAILTMDGVGEWGTTTWGVGRGSRIRLTHEIRFPHSLGLLYGAELYGRVDRHLTPRGHDELARFILPAVVEQLSDADAPAPTPASDSR